MVIHLYDENSEITATFTRSFVPWKLLKEAVKLAERLNKNSTDEEISEEDCDAIAKLIAAVFGDKFTVEQLNDGADVSEMMTVMNQIIAKAQGGAGNPTPPG